LVSLVSIYERNEVIAFAIIVQHKAQWVFTLGADVDVLLRVVAISWKNFAQTMRAV
jgi:hypothetical protein